jgi:hypothetical protein
MAETEATKTKSGSLKAEEKLDAEMEQHAGARRANERAKQQDLNQGMDTGTHESGRTGINWGPSYQVRSTASGKRQKKTEPIKTSSKETVPSGSSSKKS